MIRRFDALLLLVSAVLAAASHREPLQIIGGQTAADNQFGYQISMRYKNYHRCGGSIIDCNWVLTAAHCVNTLNASDIYIVAGSRLLNDGGQRYDVAQIIVHEANDMSQFINDIALLRMAKCIEMGPAVRLIPFEGQVVKSARSAVMSGWGLSSYPEPKTVPNEMQYLNAAILTNRKCKRKTYVDNRRFIYDSSICTYYGSKGHGECLGDSGGPLALKGVLVGITSWVSACALGYPDVFTRVSSYQDWVKAKMATPLPTP